MSCSRSEARMRLLAAYTARCVDDPDFVFSAKLSDYLDEEIVALVAEGDFLKEFSEESRQAKLRQLNAEADRRQRLLRAWRRPMPLHVVRS